MAFLTENEQKWSNIISEEYGIKDQNKLEWISKVAQIHSIYEGQQAVNPATDSSIYATPFSTLGMGNPMMPQRNGGYQSGTGYGNDGSDFHNQIKGSGDIPMSTLTMALEVAAMTIGLELVPVIPSTGPWAMLSYMDFPYAGGKLGNINETSMDGKGDNDQNKPIYIKLAAEFTEYNKLKDNDKIGADVTVTSTGGTIEGTFVGLSRIDGGVILKVKSAKKDTENVSIADVCNEEVTVTVDDVVSTAGIYRPELVTGAADHIQGFANFATGDAEPMTRAENETGTGNVIGARMFTKMVQMRSYEVRGSVTRQQLQDMPRYGVDVIGKVLEHMQNEISQHINNRILDRVFKLGVTNAVNQYKYQGVNLNLWFSKTAGGTKPFNDFTLASKMIDINGQKGTFGEVANAVTSGANENVTTHQRRIMSRILAAANVIANVSRRGRANWVVTNTQVLSALQDAANFVVAPMVNTLTQDGSQSLYFAGSIAGLNLYVDPYMKWDDTRVCVGRKSNGAEPGVVFMPYILADTIQITAEGTFAPVLLCNSRFAIVDCGFYPEQNYLTFAIDNDDSSLII